MVLKALLSSPGPSWPPLQPRLSQRLLEPALFSHPAILHLHSSQKPSHSLSASLWLDQPLLTGAPIVLSAYLYHMLSIKKKSIYFSPTKAIEGFLPFAFPAPSKIVGQSAPPPIPCAQGSSLLAAPWSLIHLLPVLSAADSTHGRALLSFRLQVADEGTHTNFCLLPNQNPTETRDFKKSVNPQEQKTRRGNNIQQEKTVLHQPWGKLRTSQIFTAPVSGVVALGTSGTSGEMGERSTKSALVGNRKNSPRPVSHSE